MAIEGRNRLLNQFLRIEIHHIGGLPIDPLPQRLELRHRQLLIIHLELHIIATAILHHHSLPIADDIKESEKRFTISLHFLRQLDLLAFLIFIVGFCEMTIIIDVVLPNQTIIDDRCQALIDSHLISVLIFQRLIFQEILRHFLRTVSHSLGDFLLQPSGKALITLAGDDSEEIHLLHLFPQLLGIHALARLVHAKTQTAAHLLALAHIAGTLLQRANLEHIGIIPALPQRRVRENETHRRTLRVPIQKQLLILHDEIVSIHIIGGGLLALHRGVHHLPLLIDGEIAGMRLLHRNRTQIGKIRVISDAELPLA